MIQCIDSMLGLLKRKPRTNVALLFLIIPVNRNPYKYGGWGQGYGPTLTYSTVLIPFSFIHNACNKNVTANVALSACTFKLPNESVKYEIGTVYGICYTVCTLYNLH